MPSVLVVDDSATDRVLAGRLLQLEQDFEISYATNGREALDSVRARVPDVIVSDLQMPDMNGLELVEAMRRDYPAVPGRASAAWLAVVVVFAVAAFWILGQPMDMRGLALG